MANMLFIAPSLSIGGASKMLTFVAESMSARGHNVCIVNLKSTQNVTDFERTISKKICVKSISSKGQKGQILEIKKIAKVFGAQIIIGFTNYPNLYARIVGAMLGIPSIMSERGDPVKTQGYTLKSKIALFLINRSSGGVFQTEGARDFYGRGLRKRGTVIPNPIFIDGEIPLVPFEGREKTIISVGRLDNIQKRYDVMLDAFKEFSQKHPEYVLKLYGKGADEENIRTWAKERDLSDKVRFMGLTTKPMQDIASDGMFVITSDYEGISNSLLEAMAVGLPCVSTDHTPGGARLLIRPYENGLLAPIGDASAIAQAMCEFAENPDLAKKCGEAAKDVVNRFSPTKIIDAWETYILSYLRKK